MNGLAIRILFIFSLIVSITCQENTCLFGQVPSPFPEMDTCCWYESNSCCDNTTTVQVEALQEYVYGNLTNSGANTNRTVETCMTYFENIFCMMCAPVSYIEIDYGTGNVTVTLCKNFCDSFYSSCVQLPEFSIDFSMLGITNGTSLCENMETLVDQVTGSSKSLHLSSSLKSLHGEIPEDYVTVVVSKHNCYEGASVDVVGSAECTPWGGDFAQSSDIENSPAANSPGEGDNDNDNDNDDNNNLYWLFIIPGVLILFCIVLFAGLIVCCVVIRRRKQAGSYAATENYPTGLEELED